MNIMLIWKVLQAILKIGDCVRKLSAFLALLIKKIQHRKKSSKCEIYLNSEALCRAESFSILLDVNYLYDVPPSWRALLRLRWYTCPNPPTSNFLPWMLYGDRSLCSLWTQMCGLNSRQLSCI